MSKKWDTLAINLAGPGKTLNSHALLDSQKIKEMFQKFYLTKNLGAEPETNPYPTVSNQMVYNCTKGKHLLSSSAGIPIPRPAARLGS